MNNLISIVSRFQVEGTVGSIRPLGTGLINDTYCVFMTGDDHPAYVLQRINHAVFRDVDLLQANIESVTRHIRAKLEAKGESDIDRKVLHFLPAQGGKTYWFDGQDYWRLMRFIPRAHTCEMVNPESAYQAGVAFGRFQAMLTDLPDPLGETIPDFHNMELRLRQLRKAVETDIVWRVAEVRPLLDEIERIAEDMCIAERLYRQEALPKRVCHCDTKVNNMMFDEDGNVLCVIDLDTVMPSFIFSDYGDFLRSAANTGREDDPDLSRVSFDMDIFRAFTKGYLQSAGAFLSSLEVKMLPYAAGLFPYMQCVRFLTDYINGDTYYKIQYPKHNLVRARAQWKLFQSVDEHSAEMAEYIECCLLYVPRVNPPFSAECVDWWLNGSRVSWYAINSVGWADFPYCPEVDFRLAHDGTSLLLQYQVTEESVRALAEADNGPVWEDSCVEFFFSLADDGIYYNLECNCAGTVLLAAGTGREGRQYAPPEVLRRIDRWSSLGRVPFAEKPISQSWKVSLVIPCSCFFLHDIQSLDGLFLRANFYKCGDKLQRPHFLSWSPIKLPAPDFHCPKFFGGVTLDSEQFLFGED